MDLALLIIQIIVALVIFNVWLFRYGKETNWRGGTAKNMEEEFATYGLSLRLMIIIGTLKVSLATLLIIGVWIPILTNLSAAILAILMLGAVSMHVKVKDPIQKTLPAITILLLSATVALLS
jgi:hypothetical protein